MCKSLSIDDVGVLRGTVFREIRPGTGLKNRPNHSSVVGVDAEERLCGSGSVARAATPFPAVLRNRANLCLDMNPQNWMVSCAGAANVVN